MGIIKAVRGTRDLVPPETELWNRVESVARDVFRRYGFGEIRTPVFESTELFVRGVGEETDVVSKEMYTWQDRGRAVGDVGQSLTLRPENTAGVVRAYIEHRMDAGGELKKLFYIGPQFRRERPQRGRYRQFWQIGAEVLGPPSAGAESSMRDAEVLEMLAMLLDELGLPRATDANGGKGWRLSLNSVGSASDRPRYIAALRQSLESVKSTMCHDCQRRAEKNPIRVLDCKVQQDQPIIERLPKIAEYLDEDSRRHFREVQEALDACGVPYVIEPRLVRGLDYYTRTTFEFTVAEGSGLGTQNALLGGGRYDGLSEMLGGPRAPGIGFAIGEDRLILILQPLAMNTGVDSSGSKFHAYVSPLGIGQNSVALALARELRSSGLRIEVGNGSFRLKKNFEAADKIAHSIVLVGPDEVEADTFVVKTFATGEQRKVARQDLVNYLS